jgi:hypothetical protein
MTIAWSTYEAQYNKTATNFGIHPSRLSIPGKPAPLTWVLIITCTPLAIASALCLWSFSFHWIVETIIWIVAGASAGASMIPVAWAIYEMHHNKNAPGFSVAGNSPAQTN